ncbi:efflux transporter outer membrane subunit [Robbsia sp. Bb-Pol-6]|uniref:Efflux transporter outer membrane subunit n=1 Tax=Robbsia betulipollinis TaxID=2981849 RepID=A0ABT3ZNH9_9BURK|nr:efflux transporter outer membrane subunit [Robbsia betulipollinis]MCY0388104.1 efflux transporter outer membrane subunit [Robbsia betulipollinis]
MPVPFLSHRRRTPLGVRRGGARVLVALPSLTALGAALTLVGCTLGPDYVAPQAATPAGYTDLPRTGGDIASRPQASEPDPAWWRAFDDPQLDSLIARAIAGNLSLQQAVLRIAAAREQVVQSAAAGLPTLSANASVKREQLGLQGILDSAHVSASTLDAVSPGAGSVLGTLTDPVNLFQGSFDASWELDLFGRVRRSVEAAQASAREDVESRNDALVSLEAEVARAYVQLRGAQLVMRTINEQIQVAQDSVDLTRERSQHGLSPQLDVENASAQLGSLRAQLPQYEAQTVQAMNGLAVLLGQAPGSLDAELSTVRPMPALPAAIPVGLPSALARRRPDVRQAEASLHAATANIGVSVASLFPSISLTGQFGLRNTQASYLTRWASHFYAVGPSVSVPIFEGGRLRASVRMARAEQASAALNYRQTVLSALQDVENGLVNYRTDQARTLALQEALGAQQNAFNLSNESYRKGIDSFLNVLDAQRQLSQAKQQLAQSQVQTGTDLVALYKALGGGWQPYQQVDMPAYRIFGPATTVGAESGDAASAGAVSTGAVSTGAVSAGAVSTGAISTGAVSTGAVSTDAASAPGPTPP